MGVGVSTIGKWVKQLQHEPEGMRVKPTPMTPEQIKLEKEILKKATAAAQVHILMSDFMNNSW